MFFVVCSAAYAGYTDPDCNLDCVVAVVVAGGGSGCLPAMSGATLHALVVVPCITCTGGVFPSMFCCTYWLQR